MLSICVLQIIQQACIIGVSWTIFAGLQHHSNATNMSGNVKVFMVNQKHGSYKLFRFPYISHIFSEYCKDSSECVRRLKSLISKLPKANQDLLKYLCRFLVTVSQKENLNKMSPMALGIVFGPNIFR